MQLAPDEKLHFVVGRLMMMMMLVLVLEMLMVVLVAEHTL